MATIEKITDFPVINIQKQKRMAVQKDAPVQKAASKKSGSTPIETRETHLKKILFAIHTINQLILKENDPKKLIERVALIMTETLGYDNSWIALLDERDEVVTMTGSAGFTVDFDPVEKKLQQGAFPNCMKKAIGQDSTVTVPDPKVVCPDCPLSSEYVGRGRLTRRLSFGDRIYGVIAVSAPSAYAADPEVQELFTEIASDLAFALHKIEADKVLRERDQHLSAVIETTQDGFWALDSDGLVVDVNEAYCRMTGYTKEELLKLHIGDLDAIETPGETAARIERIMRSGSDFFQTRHRRKDGSLFDVEISVACLKQGKWAMVCFSRDITERKQADAEREKMVAAVEQASEVIVITDPDGTIQYINPSFERVTGYTASEAIGKNSRLFKSDKHDKAFYAEMWRTIRNGQIWKGHIINKHKDGSLYTEDAAISPIRDESGAIVNYVAVKRDITHELETEQQLVQAQKMESVGRLAGGVAHDFNNLLMAIMGYTDLCRYQLPTDHSIHKWLDEIMGSAERSANLTRQLLAFARKQAIAPKVLDLNETVEVMLKLLRRLIGEHIELGWMPGASLWQVKLDPSQVDQILANLCVNSRDAIANTGKIIIETENVTVDEAYCNSHQGALPGDYVVLSVSDNGCGIEKTIIDHIFEPFFTTKAVGEGTGLGLATVYGIVKQNNGYINVYSEPGKGTTFRIYLPRFIGQAEETTTIHIEDVPIGHGETVLLVEDDKSLRTTCGLLLDTLGYKILEAETPKAALDIVSHHSGEIHLLLTDVIMPGMDGKQLAGQLCMIKPDLKVLYMSGYTASVIAQHGILEPGIPFIGKPFSRDRLARKVREVLETQEKNH